MGRIVVVKFAAREGRQQGSEVPQRKCQTPRLAGRAVVGKSGDYRL